MADYIPLKLYINHHIYELSFNKVLTQLNTAFTDLIILSSYQTNFSYWLQELKGKNKNLNFLKRRRN